jgi:hypothetical protein
MEQVLRVFGPKMAFGHSRLSSLRLFSFPANLHPTRHDEDKDFAIIELLSTGYLPEESFSFRTLTFLSEFN